MKKYLFYFSLIIAANTAFCQEVIIGAVNKNRLLTWNDFTGKPDRNSTFGANTHWNLFYRFEGISFNGDTVKFNGLAVKLEFDANLSWVKEEKQTPELLKHEQGHFNLALICQNEFIRRVNSTVFLRADFKTKLREIFAATMGKYQAMNIAYDDETDHSINHENQAKWNDLISKELSSRSILF